MNLQLYPVLAVAILSGLLLVPADRLGSIASRFLVVALALSALAVGSGTLAPSEVTSFGSLSSSNGLFVSISIGLLAGALVPWPLDHWRRWIGGLPLLVVALVSSFSVLRFFPFILGVVLGALPELLGGILPRSAGASSRDLAGSSEKWAGWQVLAVCTGVALLPSMTLSLLAPLLAVGLLAKQNWVGPIAKSRLVLPTIAGLAAVGLILIAITATGQLWLASGSVATSAGLLSTEARLAGGLGLIAVVAMAGPWPIQRLGTGVILIPAAVILCYRIGWNLVPVGIEGWTPLALLLMVPSIVLGVWCGRWEVALGLIAVTLILLGGNTAAMLAAGAGFASVGLAMTNGGRGLIRVDPISFTSERWLAGLIAVVIAGAISLLLIEEVVLCTLLTFGCAVAASRPTRDQLQVDPVLDSPCPTESDHGTYTS